MEVCETFLSIQGEGADIGLPTVFIRTARCNLECTWCDTKYSWEGGEKRSVDELVEEAASYNVPRVAITGGEPMMQAEEVSRLCKELESRRIGVLVETNGSIDLDLLRRGPATRVCMDVKCPSSGMVDRNLFTNIAKLRPSDTLKFVIAHQEDYTFARKVLERNPSPCPVIFQPVGGLDLQDLVEHVLEDRLDVRVLLQLHRYIWGDRRGT